MRKRITAKLHIASHSSAPFKDRREAGRLLAMELSEYRGKHPVVLGIPRGGIIVAQELAKALEADLDIVLSRKLRGPTQPELAIGSVAENGELFLNEMVIRELGVDRSYIQKEKEIQLAEIARRKELIRRILPRVPLKGRVVIVTDDGVATGATMQVALWSIRQEKSRSLIAAFPVATEEAIMHLAEDADEIYCLRAPPLFFAVGQFYIRFSQVEDEEVLKILDDERKKKLGESREPEKSGQSG